MRPTVSSPPRVTVAAGAFAVAELVPGLTLGRLRRDCRSCGASPDPGPAPQVNRNRHQRGTGRDPREDLENVGADAGPPEVEDAPVGVEARGADPEVVQEAPEARQQLGRDRPARTRKVKEDEEQRRDHAGPEPDAELQQARD